MTEDDFEELRRRFGADIDAWPAPHRREAAALLAGRTSTTPLDPDDDLDRLRVRLTPEATREFIERAKRVVNAGRPPCPLCGQPLDPAGHLCPRNNGYHR